MTAWEWLKKVFGVVPTDPPAPVPTDPPAPTLEPTPVPEAPSIPPPPLVAPVVPNTPAGLPVPNGLPGIIHMFGSLDDPNFVKNNIVEFELPFTMTFEGKVVTHSQCHCLMVPIFTAVLQEIKDAGLSDLVREYGGIFEMRSIRGFSSHPSCHSWGIAIDLNPTQLPLGSSARMDARIIAIFKKHGFFYGGDFIHRKDPQHYQYAINY
jgi:hypothetical protein